MIAPFVPCQVNKDHHERTISRSLLYGKQYQSTFPLKAQKSQHVALLYLKLFLLRLFHFFYLPNLAAAST